MLVLAIFSQLRSVSYSSLCYEYDPVSCTIYKITITSYLLVTTLSDSDYVLYIIWHYFDLKSANIT